MPTKQKDAEEQVEKKEPEPTTEQAETVAVKETAEAKPEAAEPKVMTPEVVEAEVVTESKEDKAERLLQEKYRQDVEQAQTALIKTAENTTPQLFTEAARRLMVNETPRYLIKQRQGKGGKTFSYVDTGYVIEQLNALCGHMWSFKQITVIDADYMRLSIEIGQFVVCGSLSIPKQDGTSAIKEQTGRAEIKMKKADNKPVDIGNDLKAAWSDCLKKCSSYFGVALDVYSGQVNRRQDVDNPDAEITETQRRRLEVLASEAGLGHAGLKKLIMEKWDYKSTKDIRKKHLALVATALQEIAEQTKVDDLGLPDDIKTGYEILETPMGRILASWNSAKAEGEEGIKKLRAKMNSLIDKKNAGDSTGGQSGNT